MSRPVKTPRAYDSSARLEAARIARRRVLDVAREHFLSHGYAGTTMASVARGAHVSVETIYKSVGAKPALLKAVLDVAIVGDDDNVPMLQRDLVARIRAEPDARRGLAIYGEHVEVSWPRQVPVQLIARAAAGLDPGATALWEQMQAERLHGMMAFATELSARGHLRPGLSVEDARDILWVLTDPEQYEVLVLQRRWPMDKVARFVVDAMTGTLLP